MNEVPDEKEKVVLSYSILAHRYKTLLLLVYVEESFYGTDSVETRHFREKV
jgi:hypothetical protein